MQGFPRENGHDLATIVKSEVNATSPAQGTLFKLAQYRAKLCQELPRSREFRPPPRHSGVAGATLSAGAAS